MSVVLPAFNEAGSLADVVRRVDDVLERLSQPGEIIIVNDGSTDDTGSIAERLQHELRRVRVVHHPANAGYGAAQRTGLKAATTDLVCLLPADGQVPPEELAKYLDAADSADVIVGRYSSRPDTAIRRVLSRTYVLVLYALYGLRLRNVNAPKLYRRSQLDAVTITSHGGFADAEIVLQLHRQGRRFRQIDVACVPRATGQSSIGVAAALAALRELWAFHRSPRRQ